MNKEKNPDVEGHIIYNARKDQLDLHDLKIQAAIISLVMSSPNHPSTRGISCPNYWRCSASTPHASAGLPLPFACAITTLCTSVHRMWPPFCSIAGLIMRTFVIQPIQGVLAFNRQFPPACKLITPLTYVQSKPYYSCPF